MTDATQRFFGLFQGSPRSHGVWDPKTKKMRTEKTPLAVTDVSAHLNGKMGAGAVPILDGDECLFGAIDIDVHGPNKQEVSVEKLDEKIRKLDLPLIACRSKSGGVHAYAFWHEPMPAKVVADALKRWATTLGFPTAEIFPKQTSLPKGALGNWINLPYFKADDTDRYAVIGGKRASFHYFLDCAENGRMGAEVPQVRGGGDAEIDLSEAPPCLVKLHDEHGTVGERNKTMFQVAVFLKRAHPDDWQVYAEKWNESAFERSLSELEMKKILGSVDKKEYSYRCKDEPCVSRCDRDLCLKRKFGIKPSLDFFAPAVTKLLKVNSDPPRYVVTIYDKDVSMESRQLLYPELFKLRVFEVTNEVVEVPPKQKMWDDFIKGLMPSVVETESGLGQKDVFLTNFRIIAQDAMIDKHMPDEAKRREYARDTGPAVIKVGAVERMVFKFAHLEKALKQRFSMQFNAADLSLWLKTIIGAEPRDISIGNRSERMWVADRDSLLREGRELNAKIDY